MKLVSKKKSGEKKQVKILLVSASGGHFEQLKMLSPLAKNYETCVVTEITKIPEKADYYLLQTGTTDKFMFFKLLVNYFKAFVIWIKEKPDFVISTGTIIVLPFSFYAKLFKKKLIYIETFARIHDGTKAGKYMYKRADLFLIQWESLKEIYPDAIYCGSLY